MRPPRGAVPAVALLVGLTAGCAREHPTAATPPSSAAPSGYADVQKKVAAAESALSAADRDAAQDGNSR